MQTDRDPPRFVHLLSYVGGDLYCRSRARLTKFALVSEVTTPRTWHHFDGIAICVACIRAFDVERTAARLLRSQNR